MLVVATKGNIIYGAIISELFQSHYGFYMLREWHIDEVDLCELVGGCTKDTQK